MMQRLVRPITRFNGLLRGAAIAALGMAALAMPGRAEAGIRLTLTSAGTTQVFVSGTDALQASTSIDGYTLVLNTVLTNFLTNPNPVGGTLVTSVAYNTGAGPVSDLSVLAEVISGALATSPLGTFTSPNNAASPVITDVSANGTSGQVTGMTFVNTTVVSAGPLTIGALAEIANTGVANTTGGYTLRNSLLIQGVAPLSTSQNTTVRSAVLNVSAVPEPATVAMVLSALPLMGLGVLRRRRLAK